MFATLLKSGLRAALLLALCAGTVHAQTAPVDDGLYRQLGERAGLVRLMDDFIVRLDADPRTAPHFKDSKRPELKRQLVDQFCSLSGGPCEYRGVDMKTAHADMELRKSDFNALVEVLQDAMQAQGIAFSAQNRLLAKLAPMHRDVITVR